MEEMYLLKDTYAVKEMYTLKVKYAIKESYTILEIYAIKAMNAVNCDSWHKFHSNDNSVTIYTGSLLYRLQLLAAVVPRVWAVDSVGCVNTISRPTGSDIS